LQGREGVRQGLALLKGEPYETAVTTEVLMATKENLDSLDLSEFQAPADFKPEL
jgi:hypothetical protein